MLKLSFWMLTEVAVYFTELNSCVFEWLCFIFSDGSASADTGQFDFLPSTYVRSQYKKMGLWNLICTSCICCPKLLIDAQREWTAHKTLPRFWDLSVDLGGTFWKILRVLLLLIFFFVKHAAKKVPFYENQNIFLYKRISYFILI